MIHSQLPTRSPEGKARNYVKSVNCEPLYYMSCLQLGGTKLVYDDVTYRGVVVSRAIVVGQVVQFERATSQRGVAMVNVRLQDSTGKCSISFYYKEGILDICVNKDKYVKAAIQLKCGGLVYKPEIKIVGLSLVQLDDYN